VEGDAEEVESSQLSLAEAERIIARLEEVVREQHVVLVGGQAVSIWTGQLQHLLDGRLTPAQVISGDIDFLGNAADVQLAADLLGGRARLAKWEDRTTLAGVAIFLDSDGHERRLDFLKSPYGMDSDDVRNTAIEIELDLPAVQHVPIWVMHPERCMESRVHNSALPNKQTDLAWRQLRASILCARAFSQLLLDERGDAAVRDVLNLNERVFRFAQERPSARIALDRDIEVFDAILDDERLPEKFRTIRLPQMRERIEALRQRERERLSP
jgi:hypothetical protein